MSKRKDIPQHTTIHGITENYVAKWAIVFFFALVMPYLNLNHLLSQETISLDTDSVATTKTTASQKRFDRAYFFGHWWGVRPSLANKGITFDLRYTSSYQGLISGSDETKFAYGGKVNAFVNLETKKMGLWKGGGFHIQFEYSHGALQPNLGGALFATNIAQFWPVNAKQTLVATSLYYSQRINNKFALLLGKFNPIDFLNQDPFFGGWGIDRFSNLIFVAPPSGIVPPVFMGGVVNFKSKPFLLTLMIFDPDNRTTDYFPGNLFTNGVNFSLSAVRDAKLFGRKTTYSLTTNYSTAEGIDYSLIGSDITSNSTKSGAWNIAFQFTHNVQENQSQPNEAWSFYLRAAIADGNPNYVKSSIVIGIGGNPIFIGRPKDTFGIGAFYYNLSDELQVSIDPTFKLHDEGGIEFYYNYAVTPWLYLGANLQYINPAKGENDHLLVAGLRSQVRL